MNQAREMSVNLVVTIATLFLGACAPSPTPKQQAEKQAGNWQWQQCVDKNGIVVDDKNCEEAKAHAHAGAGHVSPFLWYYLYGGRPLGLGSSIHSVAANRVGLAPFAGGGVARAGAFTPTHPAFSAANRSVAGPVSRGIFGGTGGSHSAVG